jgi:DNA transformation protein
MADAFVQHLLDLFSALGDVRARRMFGGHGFYQGESMFALAIEGTLYLKVDEENRAAFAAAGGAPFVYAGQKKPITVSYWTVPEEAMETPAAMRPWALLALGAALRKAQRTPAGKKKPKSPSRPGRGAPRPG